MTPKWTPELEAAIRAYSNFEERSWKRTGTTPANRKEMFNQMDEEMRDNASNGRPNLAIICAATGFPCEHSVEVMQRIARLAAKNDSDAAAGLKKIIPWAIVYETEAMSWEKAQESGIVHAVPKKKALAS
jgi:hypothetical protein